MKLRTRADVQGKKVLVRVDFNVPMKDGRITDDTRIRAHIPLLKVLKEQGAKVALVSHLGRPKGGPEIKFSLAPVAEYLKDLTGWDVRMAGDCVGESVQQAMAELPAGSFLVLENSRFYKEEEKNDAAFAKQMSEPFEVFIMDAFSAAHRAHASTRGVVDYLTSYAGPLLAGEIGALSKVRDNPEHPFVLILGGAKVSDKIGVIDNMIDNVDTILIGGGMAFTFLKAQGFNIGASLCETEKLDFAKEMLKKAHSKGVAIILPEDFIVATEVKEGALSRICDAKEITGDLMGLDIGPKASDMFARYIAAAKTVLWNGPMGVFEIDAFAEGSRRVALAMTEAHKKGAVTVVGGGDSAAAVAKFGMEDKIGHVSTGGGASLEFFEGLMLPGVEPYVE